MHTDSKWCFALCADSHSGVNPLSNDVAVKQLFNVLCALRKAEYILISLHAFQAYMMQAEIQVKRVFVISEREKCRSALGIGGIKG